jgi:hypothetical protein
MKEETTMAPTVYDIRTNADAERFQLSTTRAGRWDPTRSERDYLLSHCIQGRGGARPMIIVLHIQQGGTPGSLDSWVNGSNEDGSPRKASSTVMAQKDGSILRVIPEEHGPWTNGRLRHPTPKGQDIIATFGRAPNAYTLSIEAEGQPADVMLPEQLGAVVWQVEQWMREYDIPLERVIRHADFDQDTRHFCPGRYYEQVMAELIPDDFPFEPFGKSRAFVVPADRHAIGRTRATRVAAVVEEFDSGTEIACDGTIRGESVRGNDRWLRTSDDRHLAIHSSGLVEQTDGPAGGQMGQLCSPRGWAALNAHNAEIGQAARAKGVPPNLLKSMINRESSGNWERDGSRVAKVGRFKPDGSPNHILPFVGIFETTAAFWGYDFREMVGNKALQIEAMATIVAGLAKQYGGFDRAATVYFGGPGALDDRFCDEFGMCSDEYTRKALTDWRALDVMCAED